VKSAQTLSEELPQRDDEKGYAREGSEIDDRHVRPLLGLYRPFGRIRLWKQPLAPIAGDRLDLINSSIGLVPEVAPRAFGIDRTAVRCRSNALTKARPEEQIAPGAIVRRGAMFEQESVYLRRREREEQQQAELAPDPAARQSHLSMAKRYARKAAFFEREAEHEQQE